MSVEGYFHKGAAVWFRPAYGPGYGYQYGVDFGIPATVVQVYPLSGRVRIEFSTKDSQECRWVVVVPSSLEWRAL